MARILVADDDAQLCELLRQACEMEGHEVRTAPSVQAAVAEHRAYGPDLMIVDGSLELGGAEAVLGGILAEGRRVGCPVLVCTGYDPETLAHLPVTGILRKPFELVHLAQVVEDALAGRSAGRESGRG